MVRNVKTKPILALRSTLDRDRRLACRELSLMLCAEIMLIGDANLQRLSQPTADESIGVTLLDRLDPQRLESLTE